MKIISRGQIIFKSIKFILLIKKFCSSHHLAFVDQWVLEPMLKMFSARTYQVNSIEHYVKHNCHRASMLFIGEERELLCALPMFECGRQKVIKTTMRGSYIAKLDNVEVLIGSNFIFVDKTIVLNDMLADDSADRIAFHNALSNANHTMIPKPISRKQKHEVKQIESGVLLSGNYSFNYYHLTVEILPRMNLIDRYIPLDIPLIIDEKMVQFPQFVELLTIFNRNGRRIIELKSDNTYNFATLYFPSLPSYISPNTKPHIRFKVEDAMFDTQSLNFVRSTVLSIKSERQFARRFFLYRNAAIRMFNQDEVFEALKELGFEKVIPEELSIADQAALFNQAEIIVGGSGAAFTNLLYTNDKCKSYIITNYRYEQNTFFSSLSWFAGSQLYYITAIDNSDCGASEVESVHKNFTIEPNKVVNFILSSYYVKTDLY